MGIDNTSTYDTLVKNSRMEELVGVNDMTRKNGYRRTSCVSVDELCIGGRVGLCDEWVFTKCRWIWK